MKQAIPFITDNPFRLCNVSSNLAQTALRQKANATENATKVGLPVNIGLERIFGNEDALRCTEIVRSLVNDPVKRTVFRLFWPLSYDHEQVKLETIKDIDILALQTEGTSFHSQILFLKWWYSFIVYGDASKFEATLLSFKNLYLDSSSDVVLEEILQKENIREESSILHEAQNKAFQNLLKIGCQFAKDCWNANNTDSALIIIENIRNCDIFDDDCELALRSLTDLGDHEADAIRQARIAYKGWASERAGNDFATVYRLNLLTNALKANVSVAADWELECRNYIYAVANAIRKAANDAIDRHDFTKAKSALKVILEEPLAHEYHTGAKEDLEILEDQERATKSNTPPRQRSRPNAESNKMPGGSPAPKSGYSFSGCLVYIGIAILGGLMKSCLNSGSVPPATTPQDSSSVSNPAAFSTPFAIPDPQSERRERLKKELDELKIWLKNTAEEIERKREALTRDEQGVIEEGNAIESKRTLVEFVTQEQVDAFNEILRRLRQKRNRLNKRFEQFNDDVNEYNAKVERGREVVNALNEMRR